MTVNYSPTDPVAGASRATAPTEVTRWTDYADTIADADTRITTLENETSSGTVIAHTALASATATIDFASIPATYEHLRLVMVARGDAAVSNDELVMRLNGDATAGNYDWNRLAVNASTSAAGGLQGTSYFQCARITAGSGVANAFDAVDVLLPAYARTVGHKAMRSSNTLKIGTAAADMHLEEHAGWWRSTAAVNQITLSTAAGNFAAGSVVTLYGMNGA